MNKTITIRIPAIPHKWDIAKALADRDDLNRPFTPVAIPKLKYPSSGLKGASLWAFIRSFAP